MRRASLVRAGVVGLLAVSTAVLPLGERLMTVIYALDPVLSEARAAVGPALTPLAWMLAVFVLPATFAGLWFQRARGRRMSAEELAERSFELIGVAASIVQAPAVLAVAAALLGAERRAMLVAVALATVGVLVQAAGPRAPRRPS